MISNIQLLRAIAAFAVVFHHALNNFVKYGQTMPFDFGIGAAGVDVFFIISGFIMVHIAQQRPQTPGSFWRHRIIRIVPLYWLATFAMLIAMTLGSRLFGVQPSGLSDWDFGDVVTSLFFVADVRADGNPWPIVAVGWTLVYEAFFYLIFGMALMLHDMRKTLVFIILFMSSLVVAGTFLTDVPFFLSVYMKPIILEFSIGCILGYIYTRTEIFKLQNPKKLATPLIIFALLTMILGDQLYTLLGDFKNLPRLLFFGVPAAMIVISALIMEKSGAVFRGRILLLQGNASYAIYLFHLLILAAFYLFASKVVSVQPLPNALAVFVMSIIVCGIGGTLIHLIVEKPLHDYLRRYSGSWAFLLQMDSAGSGLLRNARTDSGSVQAHR